jgi:hypothetical protein
MSVKALYLKNYCATPISASAKYTYEGRNCLPSILASCVLVITFSGYAIFCMPKSGYCIFWLLYFPVRAFSGYAIFRFCQKTGLLHFPLCHLQSPQLAMRQSGFFLQYQELTKVTKRGFSSCLINCESHRRIPQTIPAMHK